MTQPHSCPRCHTALAADTPAGLCPNCLFQLALEPTTAALDSRLEIDTPSQAHYATSASLADGKKIFGDYELLREIARGGMGVIYRARQLSLNRIVAVKMMRPDLLVSGSELQRFRTEAEAAANLQHPNIVAIYDVGEFNGLHYFSMEYVEGQSLAELVRNHPLPANTGARYVKTIAEAIHYAHQRGILHRDLKPSNVLVDKSGQPRVTDFGLAKRFVSDSRLTATGAVLGTPSYMSPEQAEGKNNTLRPASDVYSLGAILYELLTGRPPFQAATPLDTVLLVLKSEPVAPRLLYPKLDRDLETICLKCLEKDAGRRYQSAQELADDLDRYLERKPIKARPLKGVTRAWRWCRRNPWPAMASATFILLAALATVSALTYRERLWQSLFDQIRLERLAGNRAKSLKAAAEASRIKNTLELRQEVIQTLTSPGVNLLHQFPYRGSHKPIFSPDSKVLAFHCPSIHCLEKIPTTIGSNVLVVRDVTSGKLLASTQCESGNGTFAFAPRGHSWEQKAARGNESASSSSLQPIAPSKGLNLVPSKSEHPQDDPRGVPSIASDPNAVLLAPPTIKTPINSPAPLMALSKVLLQTVTRSVEGGGSKIESVSIKEQTVRLWDPIARKDITEFQCPNQSFPAPVTGPLLLSPDGTYLVKGGTNSPIWVINSRKRTSELFDIDGEPLAITLHNELLLNAGGRIKRWALIKAPRPGMSDEPKFATPDEMTCLTVSTDGRVAILWPTDPDKRDSLSVWDILSNRQIGLLPISDKNDPKILLSPDGRLAAFQNPITPNHIQLWDMMTTSFRQRTVILGSNVKTYFDRAAFSPDGSMLAVFGTEGARGSVWILETENGGVVAILRDNHSPVWSGDSRLLATVGPEDPKISKSVPLPSYIPISNGVTMENSSLNVWEIAPSTPTYLLSEQINSLSFSPDSKLLASNGMMWEVERNKVPTLYKLSPSNLNLTGNYAFFDKAGNLWAANPNNYKSPFQLWQLSPEKRDTLLESSDDSRFEVQLKSDGKDIFAQPGAFAISPSGKLLAIGGAGSTGNGTLELWDLAMQKRLSIWNLDNWPGRTKISCVSFSPNEKRAATCAANNILVWDVATGKKLHTLGLNTSPTTAIFSSDSKLLYSADSDAIVVYEVETGYQIGLWRGHQGPVTAIAVNREGYHLASGGEDRTIRVWEPRTGRELNRWEAHKTTVTALTFEPIWGWTLASGGADGTLKLWDIHSINNELDAMGLHSRETISWATTAILTFGVGGYLLFVLAFISRHFLVKRFGLKVNPSLFDGLLKIGGYSMILGLVAMWVIPGAVPWWDNSPSAYYQRLLYVVPMFLLAILLPIVIFKRKSLSFIRKKQ